MTAKRQAYVPARFLKLYRGQAAVLAVGKPEFEVVRELTEADRATFADSADRYVQRAARHRGASWTGPGT